MVAISITRPKMRGFGDYILRISAGVEEFMPQVINHVAAHETVRKAIVLYLDEPDSFTIPECESARSALLRDTKIEVASKNIPYTSIVAKSSEERMKVVESVLSYEPDLIVICGLTNDGVELIKSLKEKDESGAARYQGIIIGGNALNTPSLLYSSYSIS